MFGRHLKVVIGGDLRGVAAAGRGDVGGEVLGQFRRPRSAEVVPELGPRREAGAFDDALQPGPQVDAGVTRVRDDELFAFLGLLEGITEVGHQLGK